MAINSNIAYDVVITGGGLIGASLLLALRHSKLKVALVEANQHLDRTDPVLDQRSLVLSLGSKLYFQELGIWQNIAPYVTEIKKIKISEQGKFAKVVLDQQSLNVPALGYVINIQLLNKAIWDSLKSTENIPVYCPAKLQEIEQTTSHIKLHLINNHTENVSITSKILVAADGARSYIRNLLAIPTTRHDYEQLALIANVEHELPNNNIAYERFSPAGPFAILPRENLHLSGIVWPWPQHQSDYIKNLSDAELLQQLQKLFGYKLGKFTKVGARQFFPLWKITADKLYQDRVLLLGSAANNIHPIGGQGFNLGLRDVKCFGKLLLQYEAALLNVSASEQNNTLITEIFSAYSISRQDDHYNLARGPHMLLNLFASSSPTVKLFRNVSMFVMDNSLILRTLIADKSMGLTA